MIHSALESYVHATREHPSPHPATLSSTQRRVEYRELSVRLRGEVQEVASVTDVNLVLEGRSLPTRLYVPLEDKCAALVVYFHGGSFVMGDLETHDALCRRLAADTGMRFLAIDYRLAPEYPFPAAVEDAVDVVRHVAGCVEDFAQRDVKLIVMGDSAGATLATVAAVLTRMEHLLAAQVLIYPTLGPEVVTDSVHSYESGYVLSVDHLRFDYGQYLGKIQDHTDPRISPLLFEDLSGAPPAIVVVAECDPLRDEAVAYAGLLEHFGVAVELLEAEGMVHGFLRLGGVIPEALDIVDDLARHLCQYVQLGS